jgi:transcriptional regulator with XRE-family HTH domain
MFLTVSASVQPDSALADALRQLRTERGDTQEDLAHKAGLTVAAFARIERGHANPTWTTVRRLASALDISLAALGETVERTQDKR